MDTGNFLSNAYQIVVILVSIALLYGAQRFMSKPIEGDEEMRTIMEQARMLKRDARQRSLEILRSSSRLDFPLSTTSSIAAKYERASEARATRKKFSHEEELRASVTELSERRVVASGETQGSW